jgi:hypothetical protein
MGVHEPSVLADGNRSGSGSSDSDRRPAHAELLATSPVKRLRVIGFVPQQSREFESLCCRREQGMEIFRVMIRPPARNYCDDDLGFPCAQQRELGPSRGDNLFGGKFLSDPVVMPAHVPCLKACSIDNGLRAGLKFKFA